MVDLAGSEEVSSKDKTIREEGININQSLSFLKDVISAAGSKGKTPNFR